MALLKIRSCLVSCCVLLLTASPPVAAQQQQVQSCSDEQIVDAFHLSFPIGEMIRTRAAALARPGMATAPPLNRFRHRQRLSTPEDRRVTAPNVDTLYSAAWFDLSEGPLQLSVPVVAPGRYVSVAVMDMAGDHLAIVHPSSVKKRELWLQGPGAKSSQAGQDDIYLPVARGWMIARVFVAGPDDLAQARTIQEALSLAGHVPALPELPTGTSSADALLASVNTELAAGPPPKSIGAALPKLRCAGLGLEGPSWENLPELVKSRWRTLMPELLEDLKKGFATETVGSWRSVHPATGTVAAPSHVRAAIALSGLGALPVEEAAYFRTDADRDGNPLHGRNHYRIQLPADVPTKSFWSLTAYDLQPDGRLFLYRNDIDRFAINSASQDLVREPDGSIVVTISSDGKMERHNWLPVPPGAFSMIFRIYKPDDEKAFAEYTPPGIEVQD
ncbi:DUF1254 domain-containing protein [Erythrobacter sp. NFXS35]|uniref:DUF1214 domain-containing protein n=1 Tax=Erythrobacter sp. NFXS35 TaxID=2818436 RepID=UPI0032DEB2C8